MTDRAANPSQLDIPSRLELFNLITQSLQATVRPAMTGQEFLGDITWQTGLLEKQPQQRITASGLRLGSLISGADHFDDDRELGSYDRIEQHAGKLVYWPSRIGALLVVTHGDEGKTNHVPAYYNPQTDRLASRLGMNTHEHPAQEGIDRLSLDPSSAYYDQLLKAFTNVRQAQIAGLIGVCIVGEVNTVPR